MEKSTIEIVKNLMKSEKISVIKNNEEWFLINGQEYQPLRDSKAEGLLELFSINQIKKSLTSEVTCFRPTAKFYSITGRQNLYPEEFETFWQAYTKSRRQRKWKAYAAWKNVSLEVRYKLPLAAAAYCRDRVATSGNEVYIPFPENFLINHEYEEFLEGGNIPEWVEQAKTHYSRYYKKRFGFEYPWKERDYSMATVDFMNLGPDKTAEFIWVFFSNKDRDVAQLTFDRGFNYGNFHGLLSGSLGKTKIKRPARCPECGARGGHKEACPERNKKSAERILETIEIKKAQDMNISLTDMFKAKIRRQQCTV